MKKTGRPKESLLGKKFGRLTVIAAAPNGSNDDVRWLCRCDCGATTDKNASRLRKGKVRSCGCYAAEVTSANRRRHGRERTAEYRAWIAMRQRCVDPNIESYPHYGGRGIRVCQRWEKFENFFADMGLRPAGMSLDRIDNDGNYEPSNCRWATLKDQGRNKSTTHWIEFQGRRMSAAAWAEELGIPRIIISARIKKSGWPVARALTEPVAPRSPR